MPNDVLWLLRLEGTIAHDYWACSYAIIMTFMRNHCIGTASCEHRLSPKPIGHITHIIILMPLLKQELVPCILDNKQHLFLGLSSRGSIIHLAWASYTPPSLG